MLIKLNTLPMSGINVIEVSPTYAPSGALTLSVSKNGGAFSVASGTASYVVIPFTGVAVNVVFAIGDLDTLGSLRWMVLDSGSGNGYASPTEHQVVAFDPQDSAALGLTNLDAAVSSRGTSSYAGGPVASVTGNIGGDLLGTCDGLSNAAVDQILDRSNGVEPSMTLRQCLRLCLSALAGKLGISGPTVTIRNTGDSKDRITATCDISGQRTSIVYDLT